MSSHRALARAPQTPRAPAQRTAGARRRPALLAARLPVLVVLLALVLAGCGGGDEVSEGAAPSPPAASVAAEPGPDASSQACPQAPTTSEPSVGAGTDLGAKPEITVPSDPPATELKVADVVDGAGPVACAGDLITVKYVGVTYASGEQFDASWDRGEDFPFQLGAGSVIEGWDTGLLGMKQGGRRELIIPPAQAYGDQAPGPEIPPGSTLIFVVDLVDVQQAAG